MIEKMRDREDCVCINKEEYQKLIDDSCLLKCLRRAGVDNWDGYEFALEEYEEMM